MNDVMYMKRAIGLAKLAIGHTSPNPLVGAVVVKDNTIIGEGYHHKAGEAHAEVHAISMAGEQAKGATLYVTLEPCSHFGKTPPCANLVIESGIERVVIGSTDPNPLVAGKGIELLEQNGIEVVTNVCLEECIKLNEHFFTYIQTRKPFVTLKSAMSLDGKIATATGQSQWITNEVARMNGHILRATHDAMMVGIGTILADDPLLNCRISGEQLYDEYIDDDTIPNDVSIHQPHVVILDSQGRTPIDAKVFSVPNRKVIIMVSPGCSVERREALTQAGATICEIETYTRRRTEKTDVRIDIKKLSIVKCLETLGEMGITSLLVEGGSHIISSFVEQRLFDKIVSYVGNQIIGGIQALPAVGGCGFSALEEAPSLTFTDIRILHNNLRIEAYRNGREGAYVYRHS